jgi:hypothetical protein
LVGKSLYQEVFIIAVQEILTGILPALGEIATAPLLKPSLFWQLGPILCIWILVEIYFGTHKKEKLGWNTALTNGISLFWIIISAMQHIFSEEGLFSWDKFLIILMFALYAIFVIVISFNHKFKASITFVFASPTPLFYFSAIVLLFAHGLLTLSWSMISAIALLFIILLVTITLLKKLLPEMKEDDDDFGASLASSSTPVSGFSDTPDTSFSSPSPSDSPPVDSFPSPQSSTPPPDSFQQPGSLEQQVTNDFNQPKF